MKLKIIVDAHENFKNPIMNEFYILLRTFLETIRSLITVLFFAIYSLIFYLMLGHTGR